MLVSIRAKFKNRLDAESAYAEVKKRLSSDKLDLITSRRGLRRRVRKGYESNWMWGTIKSALMGALVGLIFGVAFTFLFEVNGQDISTFMGTAVFLFVGAAAGVVFSTAIYFISHESDPELSKDDLKKDEAMLVVTLKDKAIGNLRKILTAYNVERIYRS